MKTINDQRTLDPIVPVVKRNHPIDVDAHLIRKFWKAARHWKKLAKTAGNLTISQKYVGYSKWVMEDLERSKEECDLIREGFGSCSDFELMSIQPHLTRMQKSQDMWGKVLMRETNNYGDKIWLFKKSTYSKIQHPTKWNHSRPWYE